MPRLVQHSSARSPRRFAPAVEALEHRLAPAVVWSFTGSKMWVEDLSGGNDHVIIHDNGTGRAGNLTIQRIGVDPRPVRINRYISDIDVRTRNGTDVVRYQLDSTLTASRRDVQVYLGSANDSFVAEVRGPNPDGSGVAMAANTSLRVIAWGGGDYDVLRGTVLGDLRAGANLGFSFTGGSPQDNWYDSFDDIYIDASHDVDIARGAVLWMNLWGQTGEDWFFVDYHGELDGRLLMHLEGGGEADLVRANFTLDAGSTGSVGDPTAPNTFPGNWNRHADVYGDDAADDIQFNIWNNGTAAVLARMFGGAGADTLTGTPNVLAVP
jgi:hypothetical protein